MSATLFGLTMPGFCPIRVADHIDEVCPLIEIDKIHRPGVLTLMDGL